jgi:hypothetical protein
MFCRKNLTANIDRTSVKKNPEFISKLADFCPNWRSRMSAFGQISANLDKIRLICGQILKALICPFSNEIWSI